MAEFPGPIVADLQLGMTAVTNKVDHVDSPFPGIWCGPGQQEECLLDVQVILKEFRQTSGDVALTPVIPKTLRGFGPSLDTTIESCPMDTHRNRAKCPYSARGTKGFCRVFPDNEPRKLCPDRPKSEQGWLDRATSFRYAEGGL